MEHGKPDEKNVPLNLFLARAGVASRRACAEIIEAGRVTVNGEVMTRPGYRVIPDDVVNLDGQPLDAPKADYVYLLLNKPVGYECSRPGRFTDRTVYDLVDLPERRLFTVGRLDKNSEGMLLLTDDGDFANRLTHPSTEIEKHYLVLVRNPLSDKDVRRMMDGIEDEGETLRAREVTVATSPWIWRIVLTEGKKREVRRLVRCCNNAVQRLRRVAIGQLSLGDLPEGQYRHLTLAEREMLFKRP